MSGAESAVRYGTQLSELERQRPELGPWLRPLGIALNAAALEPWRSLAPMCAQDRAADAPALHGALVPLEPTAVRGHVRAVLAAALGSAGRARRQEIDAAALLEIAVAQDDEQLARLAADIDTDAAILAAAAQLAALPLLHACARALAPHPVRGWTQRHCHVCGALPLMAEVIGLERTRQLRCGRCAAAWHTQVLLCPFCGERDHARLGSLVPDGAVGQVCRIETCATCRGYWKTRTVLRSAAPEALLLDDARTLELDVAAAERGYERPQRGGFATRIRIAPMSTIVS
ncbi:MAG TPA: formate dehydrogenase accessory protein FdhE [Longimicrobiales bacterium]